MRILLLSRYGKLPPASRYRFFQYIPYLQNCGHEVTVQPLLDDAYMANQYAVRRPAVLPLPLIYGKRVLALIQSGEFDLIWLEKEALPWLPARLEHGLGLKKVPYVVDYDDATFHNYDEHRSSFVRSLLGSKIAKLMARAEIVVVGNEYLADYARRAGASHIEFMPTVVDLSKYPRDICAGDSDKFTIGWIGSPPNSKHLALVAGTLSRFCREVNACLRVVGGWRVDLPADISVEYVPWSEEGEVEELRRFDVGIMPLFPGKWERGKCGLKLINYMATGLPTVASGVGVNCEIVEHGTTGFLAESPQDWLDALFELARKRELRLKMGRAGREKVEKQYSLEVAAPAMVQWLGSAGQRANGYF